MTFIFIIKIIFTVFIDIIGIFLISGVPTIYIMNAKHNNFRKINKNAKKVLWVSSLSYMIIFSILELVINGFMLVIPILLLFFLWIISSKQCIKYQIQINRKIYYDRVSPSDAAELEGIWLSDNESFRVTITKNNFSLIDINNASVVFSANRYLYFDNEKTIVIYPALSISELAQEVMGKNKQNKIAITSFKICHNDDNLILIDEEGYKYDLYLYNKNPLAI